MLNCQCRASAVIWDFVEAEWHMECCISQTLLPTVELWFFCSSPYNTGVVLGESDPWKQGRVGAAMLGDFCLVRRCLGFKLWVVFEKWFFSPVCSLDPQMKEQLLNYEMFSLLFLIAKSLICWWISFLPSHSVAWGKENLNLWRTCIILRWKWMPGKLFYYVCYWFPVGNFKQKCSETLSHICLRSNVSINHHTWFIDHSSVADRILSVCLSPMYSLPKEGDFVSIIQ